MVALAQRAATGRAALATLRARDVWLASLEPDGQSFGYYLSADRVIHLRTEQRWQAVRTLVHEARHVAQSARGFTTIVECYEPGTRLPFDGLSYLLLNRVIEADAEAIAVQVSHELARDVDASAWMTLAESPDFGPLAEAYQASIERYPDQAARAMAAVYDAWFLMGRAYGYDVYLLSWLERLAERHGPIRAASRLDHARIQELAADEPHAGYLSFARGGSASGRLDAGIYVKMAADVSRRVKALAIDPPA